MAKDFDTRRKWKKQILATAQPAPRPAAQVWMKQIPMDSARAPPMKTLLPELGDGAPGIGAERDVHSTCFKYIC